MGQLVEIDAGQAPPLKVRGVVLVLEIGADQLRAIREAEGVALLHVAGGAAVHARGEVDEVLEVLAGLAQHQTLGIRAIAFGMQPEIERHRPGLAATSSAAVADDVDAGAFDKGGLRPPLRLDDLDLDVGVHDQCSISLPPYFLCQSSSDISAGHPDR